MSPFKEFFRDTTSLLLDGDWKDQVTAVLALLGFSLGLALLGYALYKSFRDYR